MQGMAPTSGILLSVITGAATIGSIWYVFKRIYSERVGLIGALLYALSFLTVMTDREVVPTTPVVLWSVWFLFSIHLFLSKRLYFALVLTAFLYAISWNFNLALVLLVPVSFTAFILARTRPSIRMVRDSLLVGLCTMLPFIVFELRNGFLQTRAILFSASGHAAINFGEKLDRTLTLLAKNIQGIYWGNYITLADKTPLVIMSALFVLLVILRKITFRWGILMVFWTALYTIFFSRNPLNLSEYYLNGLTVLWILIPALVIELFWRRPYTMVFGVLLLALFSVVNANRFFTQPVNNSGYIHRAAIVHEIARDAREKGYPCVSVSYITSPGNDLGYRYLFYYENLHVNLPMSEAPVYTIVFPHSLVDRIDKSFGALGLIYPNYAKYTKESIAQSCSGENQNLSRPMFGFTN